MNVLATIFIAVVGTLVIVVNYFMLRQAIKRDREMQAAYKAEQKALESA